MPLIVDKIKFCFEKGKMILDSVSFKSEGTDVIAIVGPSGCGKSTLLRLLCGILPNNKNNPLEGIIEIAGISPKEFTMQGKVGFMFQEPALLPNLTVKENIALPFKLKNKPDDGQVDKIISAIGLTESLDYLPDQLSVGMKTRVELAKIFILKPELLLLDEPFAALDIRWKFLLYQELELLRQSYAPLIIIVTHDIQEALLLSNHILILGSKGRIVKELKIDKPLPRVFETDAIKNLQPEYLLIQDLIMNN